MLKQGTKVHEMEHHYVVDEGDGRPYRVAKHGLAHQTMAKIKRFASGGEVDAPYDWNKHFGAGPFKEATRETADESPATQSDFSAFDPIGASGAGGMPPADPDVRFPQPPAVPPPNTDLDAAVQEAAPAPVQNAAPPPVAASPGKPATPPGSPQALKDAQGLEQKATKDLTDLKQKQFGEIAAQQKTAADAQAADIQKSDAMLQERVARQEKLFNDMTNGRITPRSVLGGGPAQQISAAIGLILGGIGAGLTKGPNFALEVINKAIDRDMEAQKLTLQNKTNSLRIYMDQTKDLQASQHLLRADKFTAAAAQLQSAMSGMSGERAQAEGAQQLATLQRAALGETQSYVARKMQLDQEAKMQPLQLESAKLGLAQQHLGAQTQQLQMQAIQALTSGQAAPGSMGAKVDARVIEFLPPEIRSRVVSLPDGSYATARTPKDAEEVSKTNQTTGVLREKLARYRSLLDAHPKGISSTLSPNDTAKAEALRDSILTDINSLAGLQRFTHEEASIFRGRVPDITSKQLSSGHQAKLEELGKEIDDKVWGNNQTYLNISRRRRPGG